jgi:hypothetical protein
MIWSKDKVLSNGQMEGNILAVGTKENNMEKVSMLMPKVRKSMENGNMERELDG